jgi:hypothetical protein
MWKRALMQRSANGYVYGTIHNLKTAAIIARDEQLIFVHPRDYLLFM